MLKIAAIFIGLFILVGGSILFYNVSKDVESDELWSERIAITQDDAVVFVYHMHDCPFREKPFFKHKEKTLDYMKLKSHVFCPCISGHDEAMLLAISHRNICRYIDEALFNDVSLEAYEYYSNSIDTMRLENHITNFGYRNPGKNIELSRPFTTILPKRNIK